ncbi:hypothetical protein [Alishewanella longhuensis]
MAKSTRLSSKRFIPLTQALGAFNDNVFKNSLMLLLTFTAASAMPWSVDVSMNLAAGLFYLPFLLFSHYSAPSG